MTSERKDPISAQPLTSADATARLRALLVALEREAWSRAERELERAQEEASRIIDDAERRLERVRAASLSERREALTRRLEAELEQARSESEASMRDAIDGAIERLLRILGEQLDAVLASPEGEALCRRRLEAEASRARGGAIELRCGRALAPLAERAARGVAGVGVTVDDTICGLMIVAGADVRLDLTADGLARRHRDLLERELLALLERSS